MTKTTDRRKVELMLLVLTQFVVLCGLTLTFLGKRATTPLPASVVNINAATAGELSQALSVSRATGEALIAARAARRGGQWGSVYDLKRAKALKGQETGQIDERFVVRTQADVARGFWGGVAGFILAFFLFTRC